MGSILCAVSRAKRQKTTTASSFEIQSGRSSSSVNGDSTMQSCVDSCWKIIEDQCKCYVKPQFESPPIIGRQIVRLFVSSTFRDYHCERELLVKKVIPELREWCESYKLQLVECGLRWDVPAESSSRVILATCLAVIDRCLEETDDQAFFLNMLSERYGWVPSDEDVPEDICQLYQWVSGSSFTQMEILCAAYRSQNPNAAFFFRSPDFVKDLPPQFVKDFTEQDEVAKLHLKTLKEKLVERFPGQVFHYKCKVTGTEERTTGQEKVNLSGLEEFGKRVLEFFKNAILKKFPDQANVKDLDSSEQECELQKLYVNKHSECVCGLESELNKLIEFACGDMTYDAPHGVDNEQLLTENELNEWKLTLADGPAVWVKAPAGFGKTSLLAKVTSELLKKDTIHLFYHFVGSSAQSSNSVYLVERLLADLAPTLLKEKGGFSRYGSSQSLMADCLDQCRQSGKRIVIILDGLNELHDHSSSYYLDFLPPLFPRNVCCIVSARSDDSPTSARLTHCVPMELPLLGIDCRQTLAERYFGRYNKRLDPNQMRLLLSNPASDVPMWLSIACEELRTFGEFSMVTQKISNLPDSLNGLVRDILQRLIDEDETGCMKKFLCIMGSMLYGVTSDDVLCLLGDADLPMVPPITWAIIRRQLKPFVRHVSGSSERILFIHTAVQQATTELVLGDPSDRVVWSTHISDCLYSKYSNTKDTTMIGELCHHVLQSGNKSRLLQFVQGKPQYYRHIYTDKIRCNMRGQMANVQKLYICSFCVNQRNPMANFPHGQSCIVCGNPVLNSTQEAGLCIRHKIQQLPGFETCHVCKRRYPAMHIKMAAKLCMSCSFGGPHVLRCCALS